MINVIKNIMNELILNDVNNYFSGMILNIVDKL